MKAPEKSIHACFSLFLSQHKIFLTDEQRNGNKQTKFTAFSHHHNTHVQSGNGDGVFSHECASIDWLNMRHMGIKSNSTTRNNIFSSKPVHACCWWCIQVVNLPWVWYLVSFPSSLSTILTDSFGPGSEYSSTAWETRTKIAETQNSAWQRDDDTIIYAKYTARDIPVFSPRHTDENNNYARAQMNNSCRYSVRTPPPPFLFLATQIRSPVFLHFSSRTNTFSRNHTLKLTFLRHKQIQQRRDEDDAIKSGICIYRHE